LAVFHTQEHIARFSSDESSSKASDTNGLFATLPCGGLGVDSDTVWNPASTSIVARLAAGQVMCLAYSLSRGQIRNGFALVHPPGHHAEPDQAMGFCYFNSVAVAALNVLKAGLAKRVMVLDWDIHHGNGTQLATGFHPGLFYVSLHRHDGGTFFPGTGGIQDLAAIKKRQGYVVNVAWGSGCTQSTGPVDLKLRLGANENVNSAIMNVDNEEHCGKPETVQSTQLPRRFITRGCSRRYSTSSLKEVASEDVEDMNISPDSGVQMLPEDVGLRESPMVTPLVTRGCQPLHTLPHNNTSPACLFPRHSASAYQLFTPSSSTAATAAAASSDSRAKNREMDADQGLLGLSDAEYLAAMRCIVLPMAAEFNPDLVLISAGFDGATGHSHALGGYDLSPGLYAWMTRQCMSLAKGRVGLALEGGYVAASTASCVSACVNALLLPNPPAASTGVAQPPEERLTALDDCLITANSWIRTEELRRPPRPVAVQTLTEVARFHSEFGGWNCLRAVDPHSMAL
uniref:histone deacetylase n=2 Tax=Schistocephalus solidus TaxID=70667 RepID=A0A183SRC0_SCHSO